MKRKSLDTSACLIARTLDQVGEWWSLLIIRDIFMGKRRFGELTESLGVARNILSARLKRLVGCGILELRPGAAGGYQEYHLTAKGRDLHVILLALEQWGTRWADEACRESYMRVDRETGQEIAPIEIRSRDGRTLGPQDVTVAPRPAVPGPVGPQAGPQAGPRPG